MKSWDKLYQRIMMKLEKCTNQNSKFLWILLCRRTSGVYEVAFNRFSPCEETPVADSLYVGAPPRLYEVIWDPHSDSNKSDRIHSKLTLHHSSGSCSLVLFEISHHYSQVWASSMENVFNGHRFLETTRSITEKVAFPLLVTQRACSSCSSIFSQIATDFLD